MMLKTERSIERMKSLAMTRLIVTHEAAEFLRKNGNQKRPLSYATALAGSKLPSQIITWMADRVAVDEKISYSFASSPKSLLTHPRENFWVRPCFRVLQKSAANQSLDGNERLRLYSVILRDFASIGSLNGAKSVHGRLIKFGIDPDMHLWNSLVNAYAKCRSLKYAYGVFDDMPYRDVVTWTSLIGGLVAEGCERDGIDMYCQMRRDGLRPNEHTLVTVLKACSMCLVLGFVTQLHAEVLKLGVFSDIFVRSSLVDNYAKCDEIELAEGIFSCVSVHNVALWHSLLNGYERMGNGEKVMKMFCEVKESELKFNKFTLSTVLKSCVQLANLSGGKIAHCIAIKIGCELHEFLACCLLDMYSKFRVVNDALKVFGTMKDKNTVAWSAMINCLSKVGRVQEAAEVFSEMRIKGFRPNQHTFATLVGVATILGDSHYCDGVHACVLKFGFESDLFVSTALVTMYMKNESARNGWQVFKEMSSRNSASWNAFLCGICENGNIEQVPKFLQEMLDGGFKADMYTFISILRYCSRFSNFSLGKQLHVHIVKSGLEGNNFVGTALIDMCAKIGCLEEADIIFNGLIKKDVSTWTVMISGYAQNQQGEKAIKCFIQMQREDMKPNEFTLSSCLSGCLNLATLETGRQIHSLAMKYGLFGNIYIASALLELYVKSRSIEDAEAVFEGMVDRNIVSWNTIICGYSRHGLGKKAIKYFKLMLDENTLPDEITFVGILSACCHEGLLEEGKKHFHSLREVYGITPTIEHCACMVNALSREGQFNEVESFIEEWNLKQNALIWETVLWGCKLHGNVELGVKAAEKLFELEPETGDNYIVLSHIFAGRGKWDEVVKVRELMRNKGIQKRPGCSWLEGTDQLFFAQDKSHPEIKEINLQLGRLARSRFEKNLIEEETVV